jgi:hypothetical protein
LLMRVSFMGLLPDRDCLFATFRTADTDKGVQSKCHSGRKAESKADKVEFHIREGLGVPQSTTEGEEGRNYVHELIERIVGCRLSVSCRRH